MLVDYHMHTRLTDGVGEPVEYATIALERGVTEIGISDHAPLADRVTDWNMKETDLPLYVQMVCEAKRRYPQLTIKLGLEVDYLPDCADWVRDLASRYPWDYFLGSVHFIGEWTVDKSAECWAGENINERWRQYFDLWTQAAQSRLFDSLAHPDLPKKFGHFPSMDFTEIYKAALRAVRAAGCAIEVSTAGLRKPCRQIYPSANFLQLAHQLDIPVTLGSDAHLPSDVGADFDQAVALLHSCGYQQICQFNQRQRTLVSLTHR